MNKQLTHEERVDLYVDILTNKLKYPLSDFIVAQMRNAAPGEKEMKALNDALLKMGWER